MECKEVYPMLNFMSRLKLPKQLKPTHGRMRDTDGMKMFIVTFLNTVHYEMQRDSTSWYFVAGTKGVAHLALSCGWVITKYKQMKVNPDSKVAFIKVRKQTPLPPIGGGDYGCDASA